MNGKGDKRRPRQVSREQYDANWDAIFRADADAAALSDQERRRLWDKAGDDLARWLSSGMPKGAR